MSERMDVSCSSHAEGARLTFQTVPKEAVDTYRQNIKTEEILKRRE